METWANTTLMYLTIVHWLASSVYVDENFLNFLVQYSPPLVIIHCYLVSNLAFWATKVLKKVSQLLLNTVSCFCLVLAGSCPFMLLWLYPRVRWCLVWNLVCGRIVSRSALDRGTAGRSTRINWVLLLTAWNAHHASLIVHWYRLACSSVNFDSVAKIVFWPTFILSLFGGWISVASFVQLMTGFQMFLNNINLQYISNERNICEIRAVNTNRQNGNS